MTAEEQRKKYISDEYRKLLEETHATRRSFGKGGHKGVETTMELVKAFGTQDVLDYGCGKGDLAKHLDFPIQQYDPGIPGRQALPRPADIVICRDVLEHIEEAYITEVLNHLKELTQKVGWFVAVTEKARKTLANGENTHILLKPHDWWSGQFRKRWHYWKPEKRSERTITVYVEPK